MKWFKLGCVDYSKPYKAPDVVEPTKEFFESTPTVHNYKEIGKGEGIHLGWSSLPLYSNCYNTQGAWVTVR